MKKHLIAAAVAAAVAVPAMAQVTMSGRIDTSVGLAKNNASKSHSRVQSSVLTTNQIVFSGSEDLGGGLKANFNITSGFASDQANGGPSNAITENNSVGTFVLGDRGMQVGVSGGFGALDIGRSTGTMMNSTTASGLTGNIGNLSAIAVRPNNSISYTTPAVSGFTGRVVYSIGNEAVVAAPTGKQTEASIQYAAGPLLVRAAYALHTDASIAATVATTTSIYGTETGATAVRNDPKITETAAQVDYNLGVARVNFRLQTRAHNLAANLERDLTAYGIGVAIPFGATTFAADYAYTDDKRATGAGDVKVTSVTVVNALSKRTNAYAAYAGRSVGTVGAVGESLFAVGVRHSF